MATTITTTTNIMHNLSTEIIQTKARVRVCLRAAESHVHTLKQKQNRAQHPLLSLKFKKK